MTEQQTRKRPAWLPFAVVGAAVVVVMALWAALSSSENVPSAPERETFTLTGKIVVPAKVESFVPAGGCIGDTGYEDIKPDAGVTVYDDAGKVLAVGSLGYGVKSELRCAYNLIVPSVPRGAGFYQVEVAGRGRVAFEESTLVSNGAQLTLG